jgi:hypothetical protein
MLDVFWVFDVFRVLDLFWVFDVLRVLDLFWVFDVFWVLDVFFRSMMLGTVLFFRQENFHSRHDVIWIGKMRIHPL